MSSKQILLFCVLTVAFASYLTSATPLFFDNNNNNNKNNTLRFRQVNLNDILNIPSQYVRLLVRALEGLLNGNLNLNGK